MLSELEYCRQARRLRSQFRDRPAELHQALRGLNTSPEPSPVLRNPSAATLFAGEIQGAAQAGLLLHEDRQALVERGQSLGLDRFEANLVIALVLHRAPPQQPPKKGRSLFPSLLAFFLIEFAVVFSLYLLLR